MRMLAPAAAEEQSRETPCDSHGDWSFLRPHEQVPEVPVIAREEHQVSRCNLRKTRRFFPQREMRPFSAAASREKPPTSHFRLEKVFETLDASQGIPRHTRHHWRGTPRVRPQLKKCPAFPSSSRDEGPFPCFVGKGISASPSHLKKRRS